MAKVQSLIEGETVNQVLGVPTVWLGLLQYLRDSGKRIDCVQKVLMGGSAMPEALMRAYQDEYGVEMQQGWGMTEMSPLGTVGKLLPKHEDLTEDEKVGIKLKQGRLLFGVEMRTVMMTAMCCRATASPPVTSMSAARGSSTAIIAAPARTALPMTAGSRPAMSAILTRTAT